MAFEDRLSPNQATTPNRESNSPNQKNTDPSDRNLKPYTCATMTRFERPNSPAFRQVFTKPIEILQAPIMHPFHQSPMLFSPYYNPFLMSTLPINPEYLRQFNQGIVNPIAEAKPIRNENVSVHRENDRRAESTNEHDLNFSISNILKPEFGINALKKGTNKIEGPKHGGPVNSILYKPYDFVKIDDKNDSDIFKSAPLGSLCNAVSQIGAKSFAPKPKSDAKHFSASFSTSKDDLSSIRRPDSANSSISTSSSNVSSQQGLATGSDDAKSGEAGNQQWPAWVYCTRYSDRPSSGPRSRRTKKPKQPASSNTSVPPSAAAEDKRPRTAFSSSQLARLKNEFAENRYLNERRRQQLSAELGLNEAQIKIWFQNKRAKIKKSNGQKNPLALQLMAQGLYNHGTASCSEGEEEEDMIQVA